MCYKGQSGTISTIAATAQPPRSTPPKVESIGACVTRACWPAAEVRGGQIYGCSDRLAAYPKDNPVAPEDLLATIYHALGISPDNEIRDRENRPVRITDGNPVLALFG